MSFWLSEIQAVDTILSVSEAKTKIAIDDYARRLAGEEETNDIEVLNLSDQLVTGDFSDLRSTVVVIRQEIVRYPFRISGGIYRLDYDPRLVLHDQGFSKIYDCRAASAFIYN